MASSSFNLVRNSTTQRGWRRSAQSPKNRRSRIYSCHHNFSSPKEPKVHLEARSYTKRIEELIHGVKKGLQDNANIPTRAMMSIDTLRRLGIGYHFDEEITLLLEQFQDMKGDVDNDDLFSTALRFRLLRQEGYNLKQEVFNKFMDTKGRFREALLRDDLRGLLSLHEASYCGTKHEQVLSEAMLFGKKHIQATMEHLEPSIVRDVNHALVFPRQRRMVRSEARSYIEKCHRSMSTSSDIVELATLDFNLVQSLHQQELAELVGWWKNLGLINKLSFAQDRLLEFILWAVGIFPEPCFSRCRVEVAKVTAILTVIDDIYDTYGSLDELVLFTDAVQRWNIDAMEQLPEYMKICYLALYNTTNEIAYRILNEHGLSVVHQLKETWIDLSDAYLTEARWFNDGVVPNMEEYLSNGITSGGTYMALTHAFYLMGKQPHMNTLVSVKTCHKLFTHAGRILRLWDDLGTSKVEQKRGDVSSCIECCIKENGSFSQEEARVHVRGLIHNSWQNLNEESLVVFPLHNSIAKASLNLARTSQSIYQNGDDDLAPSIDEHIQSLLIKPIHHKCCSNPKI